MSKPVGSLPRWATGTHSPPYRVEPTSGEKDVGWVSGTPISSTYANWLQGVVGDWLTWLNGRLWDGHLVPTDGVDVQLVGTGGGAPALRVQSAAGVLERVSCGDPATVADAMNVRNLASAQISRASNLSLTSGAFTAIQFTGVVWDGLGAYVDLVAHDTRLTVTDAGIYRLSAQASFASDAAYCTLQLYQAGSPRSGCAAQCYAESGRTGFVNASWVVNVAAGAYFELYAEQHSGGPKNLTSATFTVERMAPGTLA